MRDRRGVRGAAAGGLPDWRNLAPPFPGSDRGPGTARRRGAACAGAEDRAGAGGPEPDRGHPCHHRSPAGPVHRHHRLRHAALVRGRGHLRDRRAAAGNPWRHPDVRPWAQGPRRRPCGRTGRRRDQQRRNHRHAGGHAPCRGGARQDRRRAAARLHRRPPARTAPDVRGYGPDRHPIPLGQARRRGPAAAADRGCVQREPGRADVHQRPCGGRNVEHRARDGPVQAARGEPEDHRGHRRRRPRSRRSRSSTPGCSRWFRTGSGWAP